MQFNSFRVPFSKIVEDAPELSFGPDDYVRVRPIFSQPTASVRQFAARVDAVTAETPVEEADAITLELIERTIEKWSLIGPDGEIPKPTTIEELNALPASLRGALFPFLAMFRGDGPDPTTAA